MAKRCLDIIASVVAILLFFPLFILFPLLIYFEDQGPVFFTQQRLGRKRVLFNMIKFRSMNQGKVTKVGKWLRQTGLDEILQFYHVLKGDMSVVGPRPLTVEDAERLGLNDGKNLRFLVRPGITGLSQLYAGKGLKLSRFLESYYSTKVSIKLDVQIIFLSFLVNLIGKRRVRSSLKYYRSRLRKKRQTKLK